MSYFQAIILGIIQGLTEFLPVSSSGHVEIGTVLFNVSTSENLLFITVIHGATALSTIVVYRKDIGIILKDLMLFRYNESMAFSSKILFSTIPVLILGLFFKDEVENLFGGRIGLVGSMLIITSLLLLFANYAKNYRKDISFGKAFIIGIAQALAVMPGISRSGATISTSLLLGVDKEKATRFSFLMVLIPILGAMLLDVINMIEEPELSRGISIPVLFSGFIAAFIIGIMACKWMISIVKRGKLIYFAIYCFIIGLTAISFSVFYAN
jgi:undecaprenyl-diphosphatase